MKRKMQYLCAPLTEGTGKVKMECLADVGRAVEKITKENEEYYLPDERPFLFVPHYALQGIGYDVRTGKEIDRDYAMAFCLYMVGVCDELIVVGEKICPGMKEEIREADRRNKKIRSITI